MPRRSKGPRLWLRPPRRNTAGKLTHAAAYVILDSGRQIGTGCGADDQKRAEQALAVYINEKYRRESSSGLRSPDRIPIADVIRIYAESRAPHHSRPDDTGRRLGRILDFFGNKLLSEINGPLCREYIRHSSTDAMARRDLEELRTAINFHRKEGLHDKIISVVLPPRRPPRERWLDRHEVAKLLWAAWRRPKCRHIAKFTLFALYTGRRASVITQAGFYKEAGRPWVDLSTGMLWPPERVRKTNKRNPPIPLPEKLLIHLRAWKRGGQRYVVQWGGHALSRLHKSMKELAIEAGLGDDVTPHVLRHTAATWQMQSGVDMLEASRYLGMTARTLEDTYAHHRPEHLVNARDAYHKHRQRFTTRTSEPKANNDEDSDA